MFNWNDLVFFLEVARQSRLTAAARRLRVDHSTVSRRISELERDLSAKLFDRKPDGFILTEQGHELFVIAERVENEMAAVPNLLGSAHSIARGRVRVAGMEGISAFYLAGRLAPLATENPGLIVELATERHLVSLTKREADIFISFLEPTGPRLVVKELGQFRLSLFASRDYLRENGEPTNSDALASHAFVDYIEDLIAIQPVHWLLDVLEPQNIVFRSSSMHAQQNAVAAGMGIGLLPLFSAKHNADLIPILPEEVRVTRKIYMSTHADMEYMPRIRRVSQYIADLVRRDGAYLNEL